MDTYSLVPKFALKAQNPRNSKEKPIFREGLKLGKSSYNGKLRTSQDSGEKLLNKDVQVLYSNYVDEYTAEAKPQSVNSDILSQTSNILEKYLPENAPEIANSKPRVRKPIVSRNFKAKKEFKA